MKYWQIFVAICIFLIFADNIYAGPSGGIIKAPQANATIKIDGKFDDWNFGFFKEEQKIILNKKNGFINAGAFDDEKDFNSITYALYDNKNLYIATDVTDDSNDKGFAQGENWKNDCIEIWIDGAGDKGTMTDRGGNDPDNYQLNVDINGIPQVYRNDNSNNILKEITAGASSKGTNYTIEVQIPFSIITELDINGTGFIGFNISFVDSDKGVWSHILWQGEVEHEPTTWGKLEFAKQKLGVSNVNNLSTTWGAIKK